MKFSNGFTLIELLLFLVVTSMLATTILLPLNTGLLKINTSHNQLIAKYLAVNCMEWYLGQKMTNGFSSLSCPQTITPGCSGTPSGYTLTATTSCTTINGDSNYMTINISVSGLGNAALTMIVAS
jgi:type II secretory pathway pseudopilin PulG